LIFDDPTEQEDWQRPPMESQLSNPRGTRSVGCMHEKNVRNPARAGPARAMHWFRITHVDNILEISILIFELKFSGMEWC
jgi:hypothetical protein